MPAAHKLIALARLAGLVVIDRFLIAVGLSGVIVFVPYVIRGYFTAIALTGLGLERLEVLLTSAAFAAHALGGVL